MFVCSQMLHDQTIGVKNVVVSLSEKCLLSLSLLLLLQNEPDTHQLWTIQ